MAFYAINARGAFIAINTYFGEKKLFYLNELKLDNVALKLRCFQDSAD